jgi:hypothetical protein
MLERILSVLSIIAQRLAEVLSNQNVLEAQQRSIIQGQAVLTDKISTLTAAVGKISAEDNTVAIEVGQILKLLTPPPQVPAGFIVEITTATSKEK